MKIAIHAEKGSFSDRWISYCESKNIPYKIVNCYHTDIVSQLKDCDGLMWHWTLNDYKSVLFAKQLFMALEIRGLNLFPDVLASWQYDDKLSQKYLFESINAPFIKTYVFYTKEEALKWVESATFPKVFKLRGGSSSVNVNLVKTRENAALLVNQAFGKGFHSINRVNRLKDRIWVLKRDKNLPALLKVIKGFARLFFPNEIEHYSNKENGYIYFQDFVDHNSYDTRLFVVGKRCFGFRRFCRKDDFRASGSGLWDPNPAYINLESVKIAFSVAKTIGSPSIAFDFIIDGPYPKIIEISYCFPQSAPDCCPGYWDEKLNWHKGKINAEEFMIKDFLDKCSPINASLIYYN